MKLKLTIGVFVLFTVVFNSNSYAQNNEADSTYQHYQNNGIENFKEELPVLISAFEHFKIKKDTCKISSFSRKIATCHDAVGNLDSALQILLWAEEYARSCGYVELSKHAIVRSGIYLSLEDFEKVISYVDDITESWPVDAPDSLINELPNNQAIAYAYLGQMDKSKAIFRGLYQQGVKNKNVNTQIDGLINLGVIHGMLDELDSAEYYLKIAVQLCTESDCSNDLALLQNLATLAANRNDPQQSLTYLDSAYRIAKRKKNISVETELLREMSIATRDNGDLDSAWNLIVDHANMQDTLFNAQLAEAIAEFSEKYESEKKALKIQELENDKLDAELRESNLKFTRNIYLSIGIGVILIAFGLWSRLRFISKTKNIIQSEKDRSDQLLLNILPAEVAEELKEKGKSEAKDFDEVTVLFSDFEAFTETATELSAQELVAEINVCFKAFDAIMSKYNIEKIKTIGDSYMAACGLHSPRTATPKDGVLASLEMLAFMESRKAERMDQGLPHFNMRMGIHTGPVVAGIVGVKKFQYDIWGDTVNIASRMESNSKPGKLNLSQTTYQRVRQEEGFNFESRGKITVKGKGQIEMWFVSLA